LRISRNDLSVHEKSNKKVHGPVFSFVLKLNDLSAGFHQSVHRSKKKLKVFKCGGDFVKISTVKNLGVLASNSKFDSPQKRPYL
jgi:hypothetical protein